jgi:deoxyadenosine/deoxycytidine kinase
VNRINTLVIEGVIGAGKSTLATMIADRHNGRLVLEQFEDNPFLPKFYQDRIRYAFPTQMAFLASRFQQNLRLQNYDLFQEMLVADYLFEKDRIFARVNLGADEFALYDRIYSIMVEKTHRPDLVIYLQSSIERLLQNIERRGRPYERNITRNYLEELTEAYNHFFHHYTRAPLIIINASELDFVNNESDYQFVEDLIFNKPLPTSTLYVTPTRT